MCHTIEYKGYYIDPHSTYFIFWDPERDRREFQGAGWSLIDCQRQIDLLVRAPRRVSQIDGEAA